MQAVGRRPILMLQAQSAQGAREGAPAEGDQSSEPLPDGEAPRSGLRESRPPLGDDIQPTRKKHGDSYVSAIVMKHTDAKKEPANPPAESRHGSLRKSLRA